MLSRIAETAINIQVIAVIIFTLVVCAGIPFGVRPYAVVSPSMEPTLPKGCLAYINEGASTSSLSTNDIITFSANDGKQIVTHRIVSVDPNTQAYTTKGDANASPDATPVKPENVIGKCVFSLPFLGFLLSAQKQSLIQVIAAVALFDLTLSLLGKYSIPLTTRRKKGQT